MMYFNATMQEESKDENGKFASIKRRLYMVNFNLLEADKWYTCQELSDMLDVTRMTMYRYIDIIKPKCKQISKRKKFYCGADFINYINTYGN